MTTQSRPESVGPELAALDLIGHDIHAAFWGGVAPKHMTQPGSSEPFGDCYKCRVVADKLRESAATHGVALRATNHQPVALDVERLARAIEQHRIQPPEYVHAHEVCRAEAERIVREYAALAKEPSDG